MESGKHENGNHQIKERDGKKPVQLAKVALRPGRNNERPTYLRSLNEDYIFG